jgi:pilus assembly protein CpaC
MMAILGQRYWSVLFFQGLLLAGGSGASSAKEGPVVDMLVQFAAIEESDVEGLDIVWQQAESGEKFAFGLVEGTLASALKDGTLTVMAEPRLQTADGEKASYVVGGELPIPVSDGSGGAAVEYKYFGVSLDIVPKILPEERLELVVNPALTKVRFDDGAGSNDTQAPTFVVHSMQVGVELTRGQTIVVSGLDETDLQTDPNGEPGIGDMPVLGSFFRQNRDGKDEMLILITPQNIIN